MATITTLNSTDNGSTSRETINTNFSNLNPSGEVVGTTDTQTLTNKTLTSPTITTPTISGYNGWQPYSAVTPTLTTDDDPTYVLTFAGVDLTSLIGVGNRVKFTQNSATVYGIVTAIAFSTNTTLTIYCGTDYSVLNTTTYPITGFNFSNIKSPFGFPLDHLKWTETASVVTSNTQASPVQDQYYNLGGLSLSVPIGCWDLKADYSAGGNKATAFSFYSAISTSTSSASDSDLLSGESFNEGTWILARHQQKNITLTSKTTYYLIVKTASASVLNLYIRGDIRKAIIKAVCAYL